MRRSLTATLAISVALALAFPASADPLRIVSQGPASQMATDQFVVHSERVGRDFLVQVTHPFATTTPGRKYPVISALDGGYGLAGPEGWVLGGSGGMEQAFIVSVGYQPRDYAMRNIDLLFPSTQAHGRTIGGGGGGAAFAAFLAEELQPFIADRYPIDPRRSVLFGHSLGGLFALEMIVDRPQAFSGYLIGSPSIWQDPGILERLAAAVHRPTGQRAFVAVGGQEDARMTEGAARTAEALSKGFVVRADTFAGATHLSYYPMAIAEGFPYVLPAEGR